jgi:hypothetical protein
MINMDLNSHLSVSRNTLLKNAKTETNIDETISFFV